MPEGNEIYRYAQLHREMFVGKTICVETPNGRFPDAALLTGRKLKSVLAHGKHLGYDFGRDRKLHVHLGRFGDFTEAKCLSLKQGARCACVGRPEPTGWSCVVQ
jgi:endonuclease-8